MHTHLITKPPRALYIPSSSSGLDEKAALADAARFGSFGSVASPHHTILSWTETEKDVLGREMRDEEEEVAHQLPQRKHTETAAQSRASENRTSRRGSARGNTSVHDHYDEEDYIESGPQDKGLKLLLFFCGPLALLTLFTLFWTLLSVVVIILTYPVRRLIQRDTTLLETLTRQSTGALNLQVSRIYTTKLETSEVNLAASYLVHLVSPILAFAVAVWAWIMAFYWVGSMAVGNPDGLDGRNDGKEFVLTTRRWWERWLMVAAR